MKRNLKEKVRDKYDKYLSKDKKNRRANATWSPKYGGGLTPEQRRLRKQARLAKQLKVWRNRKCK